MMDVVYNEAMYDFPVLSASTTPIILAKGNETAVRGRRAVVADDLDDVGLYANITDPSASVCYLHFLARH
jgi:hypothetical protein